MVDSLYIHIPFCLKKCLYCDFYSVSFESRLAKDYVDALRREIELRKGMASDLKTVYIGGGTPTVLSGADIARILSAVTDNYGIGPDAEVTIEANPKTMDSKKAEQLLAAGINRISIGVQSFDDGELRLLGRIHDSKDALNAVNDARTSGFRSISIDLIYGIPGQTPERWEETLKKAVSLEPEHISTYELTPEKKTPLFLALERGSLSLPDEDAVAEMYYGCIDTLNDHGYIHYEISNFAKPGFECRHNLNYWNRGEYLGLGAGAHSFFEGKRRSNVADIDSYLKALENAALPVAETIVITEEEALNESIFLGLRKTEGIDVEALPHTANKALEELLLQGLVELTGNRLRLTRKGLVLSNEAIVRVLLYTEKYLPSV